MWDVNWLAVCAAAVSAFLLGGLWYSRALFGELWNRGAGQKPDKPRHSGFVFAMSGVNWLVAAWLFAAWLPGDWSVARATLAGFLIGACWVASSFGVNYAFANRCVRLWAIDAGYHTAQFTLYGLILGAWR